MKEIFIITTIMKPNAVSFYENFTLKIACNETFKTYVDAEKHIKNVMTKGIYQIQKTFVIE